MQKLPRLWVYLWVRRQTFWGGGSYSDYPWSAITLTLDISSSKEQLLFILSPKTILWPWSINLSLSSATQSCPWNSSLTNIWELCRISGSTEASNITVLSGIIKVFKTLCIRYSPNTRGKINLTTERFGAHSLGLHSIQVGKSEPGLWGSRFIVPEI